jgi:hypothetical protein
MEKISSETVTNFPNQGAPFKTAGDFRGERMPFHSL